MKTSKYGDPLLDDELAELLQVMVLKNTTQMDQFFTAAEIGTAVNDRFVELYKAATAVCVADMDLREKLAAAKKARGETTQSAESELIAKRDRAFYIAVEKLKTAAKNIKPILAELTVADIHCRCGYANEQIDKWRVESNLVSCSELYDSASAVYMDAGRFLQEIAVRSTNRALEAILHLRSAGPGQNRHYVVRCGGPLIETMYTVGFDSCEQPPGPPFMTVGEAKQLAQNWVKSNDGWACVYNVKTKAIEKQLLQDPEPRTSR